MRETDLHEEEGTSRAIGWMHYRKKQGAFVLTIA